MGFACAQPILRAYTKETFEDSFEWIARHGIFRREEMGSGTYQNSIFMPAAE